MKKAKVMLLTIGLAVILSITFSFKAVRFSKHYVYTGKLKSGSCTTKVKGAAIMAGSPNVAASTVSVTKGCQDVFTVAIDD